ncbi:MAG: hypothetical protein Rhirs2KO_18510 [Rhizobiaceae bacterium]
MAGYSASNDLGGTKQSISSTYITLMALLASNATSLRRYKINEFTFGIPGTPADQAMEWDVSRVSADGTCTAITPPPLDSADGAFIGVAKANYTSEPTVTANTNLWPAGINQRATMRWVAVPGQELVIPATNAAGLAWRAKSAGYTGAAKANALFQQL